MELLNKSESFYILRLDSGEELRGEVEKFSKEQGISASWINALGSSNDLELAYYNLEKKEYETKIFSADLEIVSIVGNIALRDDTPFMHIHGTFSDRDMKVIGGHVNRCMVSATCEVSIWVGESAIGRKYDEATGLHLLCGL